MTHHTQHQSCQDSVSQFRLESLTPDTAKMMSTEQSGDVKGVILTTSGDPGSGYHFVSRYFAPWNGIPEDPVTGNGAHMLRETI